MSQFVRVGDFQNGTIYSISRATGYKVSDIIAVNPGIDIRDLTAETVIKLPAQEITTSIVNINEYGSIYSISRKTGIPVDDIIKANPNIDIHAIPSGAKIKLPSLDTTNQTLMKTVNIDDYGTIYQVHKQTGVPVDEIVNANPNLDINNIPPHTEINVPTKSIPKHPAADHPRPSTPTQEQYDNNVEKQRDVDVGNKPKSECQYPKIVLDPGHGYRKGNIGTQARNCDYINKNNQIIYKASYESLPGYVVDNPSKYIIKAHGWTINKTENILVYDVAHSVYNKLISAGYPKQKIKIYRASHEFRGTNKAKTLSERINASNLFKADYYISFHANGATYANNKINFEKRGYFILYGSKKRSYTAHAGSKNLAKDISKYYNLIPADKAGEIQLSPRGLAVFSHRHKAKRVILIELGYLTSPKDSLTLFGNIEKISSEIRDGLISNIRKEFPKCPL